MSAERSTAAVRTKVPRDAYLLFLGLFFAVASNNLVTPLLPAIRHDMAVSIAAMGGFVSTYGLARLIVDLPSGALTTRIGSRPVAVLGVTLNAVASVGAMLAPRFDLLVIARVVTGVGAGLIATVVLSALSEVAPPRIRGRVMSLYQVGNNLGIALYPLLGGLIGTLFGWRAAYGVAAAAALASGLVLASVLTRVPLRRPRGERPKEKQQDSSGRRTLKAPMLALVVIYFGVVANMINRHGFRNTVLPLFASSDLGLGELQIATGITVMSLTGILVTIPGAALGDRIGRRRIVVAGLAILAVGDLAFRWAATNFVTFLVTALVIGCGDFFSSSQTALLSDLVEGPRRAWALGAYRFFVDVGALVGPTGLAALLAFRGPTLAIGAAAGVLALAAVANQLGIRRGADRTHYDSA
jgi:MFS family permease